MINRRILECIFEPTNKEANAIVQQAIPLEVASYPRRRSSITSPVRAKAGAIIAIGCSHAATAVPERIDPGNRSWTLATTPKIVSDIDDGSLAAVRSFYRGIVDQTVAVSSPREAELAKLIENTFRHVNIALMNELAMFGASSASRVGGDRRSVHQAVRIMPFYPGHGVGGHCLPIDPPACPGG